MQKNMASYIFGTKSLEMVNAVCSRMPDTPALHHLQRGKDDPHEITG